MRRITWVLAIAVSITLVLGGCGKKDAGTVVKDLDRTVGKLESYSATGTMVLQTGIEPQEYQVDVWYKKPSYYRIALTNAKKDISQIVIRNDEGVFVLTPHLHKSFRFQSDWPDNQGQVYLYQSLVNSIVSDKERKFTTDGDAYLFDVLANYQNTALVRQKIWLNKKDYAPKQVQISDANANVLVTVNFSQFDFGKKFDKDSFDTERNLSTGSVQSLPALNTGDAGNNPPAPNNSSKPDASAQANNSGKQPASDLSFGVVEPGYLPQGVKKPSINETKLGDNKAVLLRYTGSYNYTLIESRPNDQPVSLTQGTLVDLGFGWGVLTGDQKKTLIWVADGIEFRLSSGDLPQEELVKIAIATQDQSGK